MSGESVKERYPDCSASVHCPLVDGDSLPTHPFSSRFRCVQNRADRIRTCDLFVPNEARYQTALQLVALNRATFYTFSLPLQVQNDEILAIFTFVPLKLSLGSFTPFPVRFLWMKKVSPARRQFMDDGRWTMEAKPTRWHGETPAAFESTTRIVSKIPLRFRFDASVPHYRSALRAKAALLSNRPARPLRVRPLRGRRALCIPARSALASRS